MQANYYLKVENAGLEETIKDTSYDDINTRTSVFADNRIIKLQQENIMIYLEELNTILLNDNFDVEVFEILEDAKISDYVASDGTVTQTKTDLLLKKEFVKDIFSLKGNNITDEYLNGYDNLQYTDSTDTNKVSYYFNLRTDSDVNQQIACRGAEIFNKESYYVDFDFECEQATTDAVYYDIYGPVTDPEICS